jgi:hypothetical protein
VPSAEVVITAGWAVAGLPDHVITRVDAVAQ